MQARRRRKLPDDSGGGGGGGQHIWPGQAPFYFRLVNRAPPMSQDPRRDYSFIHRGEDTLGICSLTCLDVLLTLYDQECSRSCWCERFGGADPPHNVPGLAGDLDLVKHHFPSSWPR